MVSPFTPATTEPRPGGRTHALDEAITRARDAILRAQRRDGSWEVEIEVGPVAVATQLVVERALGDGLAAERAAGQRSLVTSQRADGSWPGYPGAGEGSVTVTALAVAALEGSDHREARERGRAALATLGGLDAVAQAFRARGDVAALFLAHAGHLDRACLPQVPLALALIPGLERLLDGRLHAGNVMGALVLAAVRAPHSEERHAALDFARQRAAAYLRRWQNPNGSFNQALFPTQLMALGLHALGPAAQPMLTKARRWLDAQKRFVDGALHLQAIPNDVWSTAQALLGLVDAGVSLDDPALQQAASWLASAQHDVAQPRANQRRRGAPRRGGWAYQRDNPTMPDCDDTGMALAALDAIGIRGDTMQRGRAWLRGMQNPDGGWSAYVWGLPSKPAGAMFQQDEAPPFDDPRAALRMLLEPPPELGDPSTEGVTARALMGLGAGGAGPEDPAVTRAERFLRAQQHHSGAFWDRWMTCYLPGTATVISGACAVGLDPHRPWLARALDWMEQQQNDDGGFGETPAAFLDVSAAGAGPSMAPVTGFVLTALVDGGRGHGQAARRAADWLLTQQRADGGWDNGGWVNPYVPPDTFYLYPWSAQCTPLSGLGRYRSALARSQRST